MRGRSLRPAVEICCMSMSSRAFHAGSTGSNPVRGTRHQSVESGTTSSVRSREVAHALPTDSGVTRSKRSPRNLWTDDLPAGLAAAAIAILFALVWNSWNPSQALAAGAWQRGVASSYGPGLYGNPVACPGRPPLSRSTRGVAHRTYRCGTRLQICYRHRCTHARVIDRGPFVAGRVLDLTTRTTYELCSCSPRVWGHRTVNYRKAPL